MSRFLTGLRPSSAHSSTVLAKFYRDEFIKHQQHLERQREFYSEHAITEVEKALAKTIEQVEQLCAHDDANQLVSNLLRRFDIVTNLSAWSDPKNVH